MMNEREKKIELYMKNLDISREEAIQLIEDDENDEIGQEGEAMTEKPKKSSAMRSLPKNAKR